ncbi:MAG: M15 family metallopeptidase [Ruminococcus sp.]|nr:M15 family metallopeptidase [Ruminococcus sp.]
MPKNKVSKEKSIRRTKTLAEIFVCAVFFVASGYAVKMCSDNATVVEKSKLVDASGADDIKLPDTTETPDPDKIIFTYAPINTSEKFNGDLILVNNQHEYVSDGNENLVSILSKNDETERDFFTSVDYSYSIREVVYEPMAQMIQDFYNIYQNDTLIIYGSYRTNEFQQQLYDNYIAQGNTDDAPLVAKPGFSEHETGYAFDFSETENYDYQGTGDFAWLNENCYKYGFIIRYTEEKQDITEFQSEPWHFRYVGIPHATYITENNICFEEYIDLLLNTYSYENEHLNITGADGGEYEVFSFKADEMSDVTNIPVPTGYRYDVSGNNVDGFIITVHKNEKVEFGQENPEMNTTEPDSPTDDMPEEYETPEE